ncbi:MAG: UDP-N-acetylmuramoyl-L-alanyl-D-glutamate--2,6-diaminopimelate ligase [bacterium]|nr:UDP-N-acetylmuramoyl-L-alanyl-D-glutamate--2,6-diaminopimelate ligase [bacterium]
MIFFKSIYHYLLAWAGAIVYGFPSRKIFVLGVTGTKGKSTTVELINAILESAGKKTALSSSVRFKVDGDTEKNTSGMSMPGRLALQKFLWRAVRAGCQYALIEVTSQGIAQHRHRFIDFDAALFTNLQPEHIEAHGSFEKYRDAKVSFFKDTAKHSRKTRKLLFVNEADQSAEYFAASAGGGAKVVYFSREAFIRRELGGGTESIGDWLSSNFNLENAAAASAFVDSQGLAWPQIKKALQAFTGVPGRLEYIQRAPFSVVIDYAHTPDSLEKVYDELFSRLGKNNKLICVLGAAGGGRDKWKWPAMGKIASEYCDEVILTDEDPYDERPETIINEIARGFSEPGARNKEFLKIVDRREAIAKAISLAKKGDAVIITGKGSEDWIHIARGKKIPWSEKKVVEEIIKAATSD